MPSENRVMPSEITNRPTNNMIDQQQMHETVDMMFEKDRASPSRKETTIVMRSQDRSQKQAVNKQNEVPIEEEQYSKSGIKDISTNDLVKSRQSINPPSPVTQENSLRSSEVKNL